MPIFCNAKLPFRKLFSAEPAAAGAEAVAGRARAQYIFKAANYGTDCTVPHINNSTEAGNDDEQATQQQHSGGAGVSASPSSAKACLGWQGQKITREKDSRPVQEQ